MKQLTIATRGSKLALWQAEHIKARLEAEHPGQVTVDLAVIKTKGDKILDVPLAKVGGKGLFVKEIEEALLDGRADLAVHSMKDVPSELPDGLILGVIPERENPSDSFLSVEHGSLDGLPHGAKVGTSSLRRQAQLLTLRPDLNIVSLRGNVDTRLNKLVNGEFDAIVMATAGLKRLGLSAPRSHELTPPAFLPAVGQGALGIEYREDDEQVAELLAFLDHPPSSCRVQAERGFLHGLEGGCQVPIAGFARHHQMEDGQDWITLEGLVADTKGERVVRQSIAGPALEAVKLGQALAETLLEQGAGEILAEVYEQ